MSKLIFILTFLATTIALAEPAKLIECATSNGKIRYEGIETLVTKDGASRYQHDGQFFLAAPRSGRNYVVGEICRDASFANELSFLATANILVVDATECSRDSQSANHCTLVRRATVTMLCSYILERP